MTETNDETKIRVPYLRGFWSESKGAVSPELMQIIFSKEGSPPLVDGDPVLVVDDMPVDVRKAQLAVVAVHAGQGKRDKTGDIEEFTTGRGKKGYKSQAAGVVAFISGEAELAEPTFATFDFGGGKAAPWRKMLDTAVQFATRGLAPVPGVPSEFSHVGTVFKLERDSSKGYALWTAKAGLATAAQIAELELIFKNEAPLLEAALAKHDKTVEVWDELAA